MARPNWPRHCERDEVTYFSSSPMKRSVPVPIQRPAAPAGAGMRTRDSGLAAGYGDVLEQPGQFRVVMRVERHGGGVEDRHGLGARTADEGAHDC
jgi:hypothetical protein